MSLSTLTCQPSQDKNNLDSIFLTNFHHKYLYQNVGYDLAEWRVGQESSGWRDTTSPGGFWRCPGLVWVAVAGLRLPVVLTLFYVTFWERERETTIMQDDSCQARLFLTHSGTNAESWPDLIAFSIPCFSPNNSMPRTAVLLNVLIIKIVIDTLEMVVHQNWQIKQIFCFNISRFYR